MQTERYVPEGALLFQVPQLGMCSMFAYMSVPLHSNLSSILNEILHSYLSCSSISHIYPDREPLVVASAARLTVTFERGNKNIRPESIKQQTKPQCPIMRGTPR